MHWFAANTSPYRKDEKTKSEEKYQDRCSSKPFSVEGTSHQALSLQQGAAYTGTEGNIAAIEFMISFRAISLANN